MVVTVTQESPDQPEIYPLIEALDKSLDNQYEGFCHYRLNVSQLLSPDIHFFVARAENNCAVGIGAVKFHPDFAEVKRMYTLPQYRGHGIGERILQAVLVAARAGGATVARLETGDRLVAAVGLYRKYGFVPIPAFGEYSKTADTSYCMELQL